MKDLHIHALDWLRQHRDEHLSCGRLKLIARCGEYLSERFEVARRSAEISALHAFAEVEADPQGWRIDFLSTTATALFMYHPVTGQTKFFLTADIPADASCWPTAGDLTKHC